LICGPAYGASASLMWMFVIYQLFYSSFYVFGIFPILIERPQMSFFAVLVALLVNIGLNVAWIPAYGTFGAAAAALTSMVVLVLVAQGAFRGLRVEWRTWLVMALLFLPALRQRPVLLASYLALIVVVLATPWILRREEKELLRERLLHSLRFRGEG